MLWIRALVFTVLMPGLVAVYVPLRIVESRPPAPGLSRLGWVPIIAGAAVYLRCLLSFLAAKGTPAIFFSRALRAVWGEEPPSLVRSGLYRYSRNPMYVGVLLVLLGESIVFASGALAWYTAGAFVFFNFIVRFVEEPHLKAREGESFEEYLRSTPRWFGLRRAGRKQT